MALKRLSLIRGDSQTYTLTFKQNNNVLYDISAWTIYFTLKENPNLPDSAASLQKILVAGTNGTTGFGTSGTSGIATIQLFPADTVNLTPETYDFDIQVRTAAAEVYTVLKGKFDLEYDVSRASTAGV
jgi:hypothetical protein